jgi:hypothetical protein
MPTTFDPRTISTHVFEALSQLRSTEEKTEENPDKLKANLKDQKNQAIELYTYLATWGLMRLKAEEMALQKSDSNKHKVDTVKAYFKCLEKLCFSEVQNLAGNTGLNTLKNMTADEYLGLTGLGLELANEFSFWANAVYYDIQGGQ